VDHVAVSIDAFHEAEVPRPRLFRVLHELLAAGTDASIQACGTGPGDPYLAALTYQVRREFADRLPMLVTTVRPVGRARSWLARPDPQAAENVAHLPPARPCDMASWPVVGFDGAIAACCNTDVLDSRPAPAHLRLGHISTTAWPEVRRACVSSLVLRGLRTEGPVRLARRFAEPGPPEAAPSDGGYCETCQALSARPETLRRIEAHADRPAVALIEQHAIALQLRAGPAGFARRHGEPALADRVLLGWPGAEQAACAR
jgi:hypothetical protein